MPRAVSHKVIVKTEVEANQLLESIRWNGIPKSPFIAFSPVYKCKNDRYKCKQSGKYFTARTNTLFHGSHVPLTSWFKAITLLQQNPNMVAADLAGELELSHKSSSIMLSKLRNRLGIYKMRDRQAMELEVNLGALELHDWLNILK